MQEKIIKALKNPVWAINRFLMKKYIVPKYLKINVETHKSFANCILGDSNDYLDVVNEIINNKIFNDEINKEFELTGLSKRYPMDLYSWPVTLYYFIRKLKPNLFFETGCFYGISTSYILAALKKNGYGKLYTIDLPAYFTKGGYYDSNPYKKETERTSSLPPNRGPGFIIPDFLKDQWQLLLGSSNVELPKLLKELNSIDLFLHDSLHSYENMKFEFEIALKYLKKGGFIFSDNIDWNSAFYDFSKKHKLAYYTYLAYYESRKLNHNFGSIKK